MLPVLLLASAVAVFFYGPVFSTPQISGAPQTPPHSVLRPQSLPDSQMKPSLLAGSPVAPPKAASAFVGAEEDLKSSGYGTVVATALAATALHATESESSTSNPLMDKLKLVVFAGLWYFFNIQYNLVNKQVLNIFPAVWATAWWQLAAGIPIAGAMWLTGLLKKPKVTQSELMTLLPVGAAHSAGQILTVASLGAVAVSFTHTVKALEPGVNAIASGILLGQVFHPLVYASLVPVFAGVAMASAGEMSFTMFGFLTAFGSNFAFVLRNVLSTKFGKVGDMGDDPITRKTNQLSVLTAVAALVLLPVVAVIPGGLTAVPAAWKAALATGVSSSKLASMLVLSGFHFFMYQMSSFWVLSCVQPITHSVLNTLKRIVIIIVSVIVFKNPVSFLSATGTLTAIGGVLLYSLTKAHFAKKG